MNKFMPKWETLTVEQLKNNIRDFAGTEFEWKARAELQRRGIPQPTE